VTGILATRFGAVAATFEARSVRSGRGHSSRNFRQAPRFSLDTTMAGLPTRTYRRRAARDLYLRKPDDC